MLKNEIRYAQFRFGLVDDEKVLQDTFRMRYEVYVTEFGFEKADDHPEGFESDEYENESLHFACLNDNNAVVGTLRLVLHSDKGLPIEHAAKFTVPGKMPGPDQVAEISRLTVTKDLRRRKEDGIYGLESYLKKSQGGVLPDDGSIPDEMKGRKNPIILLGLCQVMYHESKRRGLTHWFMITEDKIFHTFQKYGFLFERIGEPVWYHGWRIPYLGILEDIENHVMQTNPAMVDAMIGSLEPEFHPKFAHCSS